MGEDIRRRVFKSWEAEVRRPGFQWRLSDLVTR